MTAVKQIFTLFSVAASCGASPNSLRGSGRALMGDYFPRVEHVILISVDGLHAQDLTNYVTEYPNSTMAKLAASGVVYDKTYLPGPSDSFPGMLSLATGGTPQETGVYYDVSYAGMYYSPDACPDGPGSKPTGSPGYGVAWDEGIDINNTMISGGGSPGFGASSLNATQLPRDANCIPTLPHQYNKINTIFEVVKEAGGHTAWTDKHPAYEILAGPTGTGLDDLYTPEINCACADADGNPTLVDGSGGDYTKDPSLTHIYDQLHVDAILNHINGKDSTGKAAAPVPNIFGGNYQSLSVAQKYAGYLDTEATPSSTVLAALDFVDKSFASFQAALEKNSLLDKTAFIITAKHGQSPIAPNTTHLIAPATLESVLTAANISVAAYVEDDIAMVYLTDSSQASDAIAAFKKVQGNNSYGIQSVGTAADYGLESDVAGRQPDVVIAVQPGVVYAKLTSGKLAEHGGLTLDDLHVGLLVSLPSGFSGKHVSTPVGTTQVAPTILKLLGLDTDALYANPGVLPGLDNPLDYSS